MIEEHRKRTVDSLVLELTAKIVGSIRRTVEDAYDRGHTDFRREIEAAALALIKSDQIETLPPVIEYKTDEE